jgi:hypothetical protein
MNPTAIIRGRKFESDIRGLEGALQPPHELGMRDICYLAAADEHVIRSWFQIHVTQRVSKTALDPIPGDRIAGAPRDNEPDT